MYSNHVQVECDPEEAGVDEGIYAFINRPRVWERHQRNNLRIIPAVVPKPM